MNENYCEVWLITTNTFLLLVARSLIYLRIYMYFIFYLIIGGGRLQVHCDNIYNVMWLRNTVDL